MTPFETTPSSFVKTTEDAILGGEWFAGAGLGIFVHWDHASQLGIEIGWPLVGHSVALGQPEDVVTIAEYQSVASTFNPTEWDPVTLARLARRAGARYVVFTTRHHAGFSMFHTTHSTFGIESAPFGRDITRELVDAVRAEGLRVGLYYSLSDWNHPDYPAFEMADRPYDFTTHRLPTLDQWERYRAYLRGQLTELLTNYGEIDLLWFDGYWERTAEQWDAAGLRELIKELQPKVVINDRLPGQGDYVTPEQGFPLQTPNGPWELCLTIGQSWGWNPDDSPTKSVVRILSTLIDVVSRGGNLLLNVSPKGDGGLDQSQKETLDAVGQWMEAHAESVIGVSPTQGIAFHGPSTARQGKLYLHLVMRPLEEIVVRGLPVHRVRRVTLMADGSELAYETIAAVNETAHEMRIGAPAASGAPLDVVMIEFD